MDNRLGGKNYQPRRSFKRRLQTRNILYASIKPMRSVSYILTYVGAHRKSKYKYVALDGRPAGKGKKANSQTDLSASSLNRSSKGNHNETKSILRGSTSTLRLIIIMGRENRRSCCPLPSLRNSSNVPDSECSGRRAILASPFCWLAPSRRKSDFCVTHPTAMQHEACKFAQHGMEQEVS